MARFASHDSPEVRIRRRDQLLPGLTAVAEDWGRRAAPGESTESRAGREARGRASPAAASQGRGEG